MQRLKDFLTGASEESNESLLAFELRAQHLKACLQLLRSCASSYAYKREKATYFC